MIVFRSALLAAQLFLAVPAASRPDVVREKFNAFNRHDVDAIERLYATDAHLHSPDYPDLVGNKPIADTYRRIFAAIPDAQDEVKTLEVGPERVYVQFVLSGHLGGAPDKPLSIRIISVYRVEGGQIAEDDSYYDRGQR